MFANARLVSPAEFIAAGAGANWTSETLGQPGTDEDSAELHTLGSGPGQGSKVTARLFGSAQTCARARTVQSDVVCLC